VRADPEDVSDGGLPTRLGAECWRRSRASWELTIWLAEDVRAGKRVPSFARRRALEGFTTARTIRLAWFECAPARNRSIDLIRAERTRLRFAPDLVLESEWTLHARP